MKELKHIFCEKLCLVVSTNYLFYAYRAPRPCSSASTLHKSGTSKENRRDHRIGHGLINYIGTKAKCRHLKKLTRKGTLRQAFICLRPPSLLGFCLVNPCRLWSPTGLNTPPPLSATYTVLCHKEGGEG
jgi:hypothetical protein